MFTSYDKQPQEAIATVLNRDEKHTCATVKVTNPDETFSIEYLNHPKDDHACFNVATDHAPEDVGSFDLMDSGLGYCVFETEADTVDKIYRELVELAEAASPGEFAIGGAATKHVPHSDWEPSLGDGVRMLKNWLDPRA